MTPKPLIPGLTVVKKPMESYLVVRDADGDRELTGKECDQIAAAMSPDKEKIAIEALNALSARYPNDLIFSNAGFAIGVVHCIVDATLRVRYLPFGRYWSCRTQRRSTFTTCLPARPKVRERKKDKPPESVSFPRALA